MVCELIFAINAMEAWGYPAGVRSSRTWRFESPDSNRPPATGRCDKVGRVAAKRATSEGWLQRRSQLRLWLRLRDVICPGHLERLHDASRWSVFLRSQWGHLKPDELLRLHAAAIWHYAVRYPI